MQRELPSILMHLPSLPTSAQLPCLDAQAPAKKVEEEDDDEDDDDEVD